MKERINLQLTTSSIKYIPCRFQLIYSLLVSVKMLFLILIWTNYNKINYIPDLIYSSQIKTSEIRKVLVLKDGKSYLEGCNEGRVAVFFFKGYFIFINLYINIILKIKFNLFIIRCILILYF